LPAGLVESELFGHEKGAFTGAIQRKLGRFELANHATIFLDELGELPLDTQAKLLRVLQQGELERLGSAQTIRVNVRVIAATNQPLEKLVAENKFRADLFYRLNVYPIHLPPLRERIADIVPLAQFFTQKFRTRLRRPIKSIAQESLRRMEQYPWPGNIRELEHTIERAVLLCQTDTLHVDLPTAATASVTAAEAAEELVSLDENTRRYLQRVLRQTNGMVEGRGGAAEILGLPASTLRSKMKKLGISLVREIKS
jgi:transcriptional regulator with GAF, ATPase, and Fis domain